MNTAALRKIILRELAEAPVDGLTQAGLLVLVQQTAPRTAPADLRDELAWLRDRELVACIVDALDPDNRDARTWTITKAGQLHLKK